MGLVDNLWQITRAKEYTSLRESKGHQVRSPIMLCDSFLIIIVIGEYRRHHRRHRQ